MVGEHQGTPFDNLVYLDTRNWKQVVSSAVSAPPSRGAPMTPRTTCTTRPSCPGTLLCDGNQSCGDTSGQEAHDGASDVYDYYNVNFGRDSLNDAGMTLVSSVHVGSNWNNAAFYNNMMVYGDGDGVNYSPLSGAYDVIAHELTHGRRQFRSRPALRERVRCPERRLGRHLWCLGRSASRWQRQRQYLEVGRSRSHSGCSRRRTALHGQPDPSTAIPPTTILSACTRGVAGRATTMTPAASTATRASPTWPTTYSSKAVPIRAARPLRWSPGSVSISLSRCSIAR